jgi:N-acetylneuraminate synthase
MPGNRSGGIPGVEIVAELSANHNGSLSRALDLVRAAARAGVDAIKLQTYTPDTITLDSDFSNFKVSSNHALWGGKKLYDLYAEAHTPWEWHQPIFELATTLGVEAFSTPFDETAVDFLENLGVKRYKIASLEIVDIPLISKVASTGKPLILSTGASTLEEVDTAVEAIMEVNSKALVTLLLCSSSYPANPNSIGLGNMALLRERYGTPVGFSDHTEGLGVAVAAAALGASMIEKHMTLNTTENGPDESFSATENWMTILVRSAREAALASQDRQFGPAPGEEESRRLRPSLWVTSNVKKGDLISAENVRSVRPSGGLVPAELNGIIGRKFLKDTEKATPMTRELYSA